MVMIKNTSSYLLIFMILLGISSCATDPLLRKYIVGDWRPVKVGTMDLQKLLPKDDTVPYQYTQEEIKMMIELKQSLSRKAADGTLQKSTGTDFSIMLTEANTAYNFTSKGIGIRYHPYQPIKGKWKLKNKGTRLVLTDLKTKEQFILKIDSLSSKKMVATNNNLPNGLKITYIKGNEDGSQ
jgi:hypothetical protein